jgi:hypothetical protein
MTKFVMPEEELILCIRNVLISFIVDACKDELSGVERQCFLKSESSNWKLPLLEIMVGEHDRQATVFLKWK